MPRYILVPPRLRLCPTPVWSTDNLPSRAFAVQSVHAVLSTCARHVQSALTSLALQAALVEAKAAETATREAAAKLAADLAAVNASSEQQREYVQQIEGKQPAF